jgi:hypothetical protein
MYKSLPPEFSMVLDLVSRCNVEFDIAQLRTIQAAARANTLTILWGVYEDPIGFIVWAGVNQDSLQMTNRFKLSPSQLWEYKEGHITQILHVLFVPPFNFEAKTQLRKFVRGRRVIFYTRKGKNSLFIRTSSGFRKSEKLC